MNGKTIKVKEKKSKLVDIKTKQNISSVEDFINKVNDEERRKNSLVIIEMMKKASGEKPKMWGASIIGFGLKRYKSPASGREVEWFQLGFSPRKASLSLHLMLDLKKYGGTLNKLGKFKTGAGCIYINKLTDIDVNVLKQLIEAAAKK